MDGDQQAQANAQQAIAAAARAAEEAIAAGINVEVQQIGYFGQALINTVARQNDLFTQIVQQEQQRQQHRAHRDQIPSGTRAPCWGADQIKDSSWDMHLQAFNSYVRLTRMSDEMAKEMLVTSVKGPKSNLLLGLGPGAVGWDNLSYRDLQTELTAIFRPAAEYSMARNNYKARKQATTESVQAYAAAKKSLYLQAYPQANAQTATELTNDFISGLVVPEVIRQVLNKGPYNSLSAATNAALQATGAERELVQLGFKKDTTGLESQASYNPSRAEIELQTGIRAEPMDVNALAPELDELDLEDDQTDNVDQIDIQQYEFCLAALTNNGIFAGNCFRCGIYGHSARNCSKFPATRRGGRTGRSRGSGRGGRSTTGQYRSGRGGAPRPSQWPARDNKGKFLKRGGRPTQQYQSHGFNELIEGEDPPDLGETQEEYQQDFQQQGV